MRPAIPPHRVKHGTTAGYYWHRTNGGADSACDACRKAHRDYINAYRKRRRDQKKVLESMLSGGQTNHQKVKLTIAEYEAIMKTIKEDLDL